MRVVNPDQIREIDRRCAEEFGILTSRLMENAGRNVYSETIAYSKTKNIDISKAKIACVCGKGNNGGDGIVASRYFSNCGADVTVITVDMFANLDYIQDKIENCDIIIDAILGTGLNANVRGSYSDVIDIINNADKPIVVSVDIPSGISGYTGEIMGNAVKADLTVVLALLKHGNLLNPGKEYCGDIVISDIGIPKELMNNE